MLGLLRSILPFLNRRSSSRFGRFGDRTSALASRYGTRRNGGIALGTLASIAAPFIINKIRQRRAQAAGSY